MTSFDVVAHLRRLAKTRKIGHTGTLDPGAAGVLPLCAGSATKAIEFLVDKDKNYRCELVLGIETDTQDAFGTITARAKVNSADSEIASALKALKGKGRQIPPMYSAVKMGGKKLYELARAGVTVDREPREITIHEITLIDILRDIQAGPDTNETQTRVLFEVECSKGTYIRTLCHDIGRLLGCGAYMSFLVRTASGSFKIEQASTLEELGRFAAEGKLGEKLIPVDKVFDGFEKITLDTFQEKRILNGVAVETEAGGGWKDGRLLRLYSSAGRFIAVGEVTLRDPAAIIKSKKLF